MVVPATRNQPAAAIARAWSLARSIAPTNGECGTWSSSSSSRRHRSDRSGALHLITTVRMSAAPSRRAMGGVMSSSSARAREAGGAVRELPAEHHLGVVPELRRDLATRVAAANEQRVLVDEAAAVVVADF